jgi:2-polyprenyl-6-methoxyphenol hydroxylase-like FAD-dependent oxidoreductase
MSQRETDVVIVGAGPTGLFLALLLAKLGVRARIVDAAEGPGTTSRALAVQARTLEIYRQVGLARGGASIAVLVLGAHQPVAARRARSARRSVDRGSGSEPVTRSG